MPLLRDLTWGFLPKEDYTPLQANIKVGLCPGVVVKFHFRVDQKSVEQEWKIAIIVRFELGRKFVERKLLAVTREYQSRGCVLE